MTTVTRPLAWCGRRDVVPDRVWPREMQGLPRNHLIYPRGCFVGARRGQLRAMAIDGIDERGRTDLGRIRRRADEIANGAVDPSTDAVREVGRLVAELAAAVERLGSPGEPPDHGDPMRNRTENEVPPYATR